MSGTAQPKVALSAPKTGLRAPWVPVAVGAAVLMLAARFLLPANVYGALFTGMAQGSMIALVALGYTMVYGILKLINFAHSEVFMMGAFAGLFLILAFGGAASPILSGVLGTLGAMVIAGILGVLVERVAYAPLRARGRGRANTRVTRWSPPWG